MRAIHRQLLPIATITKVTMLKFEAVLFDCDGVLVDSEPITIGVLRDLLQELGWTLSLAECMRLFVGKAVKDEIEVIHQHTGKRVDANWFARFWKLRNQALEDRLTPIAGAPQAVQAIHARWQGRIACASGADRPKVELQLHKTGLMSFFENRIFSGHEMARSKPFPDVYLAAADALAVPARACAVVEDTVTGVMSGVAAGATVFAYAADGQGDALLAAGAARVFTSMAHLPTMLLSA
jgi:HAD superfamily hydrolase (TIGR01509 family)